MEEMEANKKSQIERKRQELDFKVEKTFEER